MLLLPDCPPIASTTTEDLLLRVLENKQLQETGTSFVHTEATACNKKEIYVLQGEAATVDLGKEQPVIGSFDATTCCIAVAVCVQASCARVIHYDEGTSSDGTCVDELFKGMQAPMLWIVGGYCDTSGTGRSVCCNLLGRFHALGLPISVQLALILDHNTAEDGSPRCRELALDLETRRAFPGIPRFRGPALPRRMGSMWLGFMQPAESTPGHLLTAVYDPAMASFALPGLNTPGLSQHVVWCLERWLRLPDLTLLQTISTSPDHEGPDFVEDQRMAFRWLLQLNEGVVGAEDSICYQWSPTGWHAVESIEAACEDAVL